MLLKRLAGSEGPMTAVTWQQLLAGASTPDEVISIAREFVAAIDHAALAKLPPACRPGQLFQTQDITSFAYEVVRHECRQEDEVADTIHKLAAFFSRASVRLSQLAAPNLVSAIKLFG